MPIDRSHRGTIHLEDGVVLGHDHVEGDQHILRIEAPRVAGGATPGSFVHVRCSEALPMRRPLSIMRADPVEGWIELLYKVVGAGSRQLARHVPGQRLSLLGPVGRGFAPTPGRVRPVLIGGGVGIPPLIFLCDTLRRRPEAPRPIAFLGSEVPFPFIPRPSEILVDGVPADSIACAPLLDDWGIPSRLASLRGFAGCYEGYVTDLARGWLERLDRHARDQVELFACGPAPMLAACARLAAEFDVPGQICLEEFMACAVGGCAGCAVPVHGPGAVAMKRVCVDGPVFAAHTIYPQ